jgi:hypothetical protein
MVRTLKGLTERLRNPQFWLLAPSILALLCFLELPAFVWVLLGPASSRSAVSGQVSFRPRSLLPVHIMVAPSPSSVVAVKDGALAPPKACP